MPPLSFAEALTTLRTAYDVHLQGRKALERAGHHRAPNQLANAVAQLLDVVNEQNLDVVEGVPPSRFYGRGIPALLKQAPTVVPLNPKPLIAEVETPAQERLRIAAAIERARVRDAAEANYPGVC